MTRRSGGLKGLATFLGSGALTHASGFFFRRDERLFLVTSRHVLIDEPTASLDPDVADRMRSWLQDYQRRTGATTGAWPGVQAFCGWKGSGSTGKGGCGPYYAAQFAREQSRTIME